MDDKIKQLLRDLGSAINESISSSEDVNRHIQKIRDEGYNLYVVLDATIGLNKQGEEDSEERPPATAELIVRVPHQRQRPLAAAWTGHRSDAQGPDRAPCRAVGAEQ